MSQVLKMDRPLVSVDTVIFTVHEQSLQVLLVRRPEVATDPYPAMWALPGGFVDTTRDANLESCARRKLRDKTGIDAPYLEQLGSWGSATRDPRGWSTTHVYFALLAHASLTPGGNAIDTQWVAQGPQRLRERLAFDHAELLSAALARLRAKVEYTSLPLYLMGPEFTLSELQKTYEIVLARALEKKAFRTRISSAQILEPVPRMKSGSTRPAQLFRVKSRRKAHTFARPFGSAAAP